MMHGNHNPPSHAPNKWHCCLCLRFVKRTSDSSILRGLRCCRHGDSHGRSNTVEHPPKLCDLPWQVLSGGVLLPPLLLFFSGVLPRRAFLGRCSQFQTDWAFQSREGLERTNIALLGNAVLKRANQANQTLIQHVCIASKIRQPDDASVRELPGHNASVLYIAMPVSIPWLGVCSQQRQASASATTSMGSRQLATPGSERGISLWRRPQGEKDEGTKGELEKGGARTVSCTRRRRQDSRSASSKPPAGELPAAEVVASACRLRVRYSKTSVSRRRQASGRGVGPACGSPAGSAGMPLVSASRLALCGDCP